MSLQIAFRHSFPSRRQPTRLLDIHIDAPTPGTIALFGPSGAGKSTIAAATAGLLRPDQGRIVLDGEVLTDSASMRFIPPERRRIGIVFQDGRLFPHLTVSANLRYGQRRASGAPAIGWDEVIDLLGIAALLPRRPATLSGGEQQRVAIGRALLSQPRLLVMDEPLASLDAARRAEILPFLSRLRTQLALPILYVTHAMDEVARLADTLVLIQDGRCTASGPLVSMLARAGLPPAGRTDAAAVVECRIADHLPARALTRLALTQALGLHLLVPLQDRPPGTRLRVRIPAGEVILATQTPAAISVQNILPVTIAAVVPLTAGPTTGQVLVELQAGGAPLLARITQDAVDRLDLGSGRPALALIKSVAVELLG